MLVYKCYRILKLKTVQFQQDDWKVYARRNHFQFNQHMKTHDGSFASSRVLSSPSGSWWVVMIFIKLDILLKCCKLFENLREINRELYHSQNILRERWICTWQMIGTYQLVKTVHFFFKTTFPLDVIVTRIWKFYRDK